MLMCVYPFVHVATGTAKSTVEYMHRGGNIFMPLKFKCFCFTDMFHRLCLGIKMISKLHMFRR